MNKNGLNKNGLSLTALAAVMITAIFWLASTSQSSNSDSGTSTTSTGTATSAVQAAACASARTLRLQISQVQQQIFQDMRANEPQPGDGELAALNRPPSNGLNLLRQKAALQSELTAQRAVCNGR